MLKKSKGRRKVEMKKMENESNLQVTFSKRRNGVFKKASELCIMCGAEAAIIVFSPGGKVFSFGHPSVEEIADRFLTGQMPLNTGALQLVEAYRNVSVQELNLKLTMVNDLLELERKRGEELVQRILASRAECGLEKPVEELNDMAQLELLRVSLEHLKFKVTNESENHLAAHQNKNLAAKASEFQLGFGVGGGPNNNAGFIGDGYMPLHALNSRYGGHF